MQLTSEQINHFIQEIEKANLLDMENKSDEALNIYLLLWEELPEPKQQQPEQISNWLINCIFNNYFDRCDFIHAKTWASKALNNDTAKTDDYEYFQMGRVCYELKEFDEAMQYFSIAYERGKKSAFSEFDKKYWDFYINKK